ncbi:hypothetical protein Hamer_G023726, partial [Homarus americanus]
MSGGRHAAPMTQETGRRLSGDRQGNKKPSGTSAPSRTSMSGLLPSPVVCGDEPSFLALFHNGSSKRIADGYDNNNLKYNGTARQQENGGGRLGLVNGERSSDSEDSGATSGATSGKEASPGYEESSGSEQSSNPPLSEDTRGDDDIEPAPAPRRIRASLPRSQTTPVLNGDHTLDDALRPLTHYGQESPSSENTRFNNGLNRIRAAHEINVSKLAYLEALFQRAKLEEIRLKSLTSDSRTSEKRTHKSLSKSLQSPESGYKSLPSSISDYGLRSYSSSNSSANVSNSTCGSTLPDGQALLRTIENRLQHARPQDKNSGRTLYQCGGSSSVGSLSRLTGLSPATSGTSTPARFVSPSRSDGHAVSRGSSATTPNSTPATTPGGTPKRPDGLGRPSGHVSQRSLPHSYRSRSAYSSPAVSPQRGPDPGGFLVSPSGPAPRRFSSLDLRGRGQLRQLPLRHTAHGFPTCVLPISPPSPAQGTQAFHRKMQLFFEIMDTQSRFSQLAQYYPYEQSHQK